MCQLLGVISNMPVDIRLSLQEFQHRGAGNPHGWGFAYLEKNAWKIIKQPERLDRVNTQDERFEFLSRIVIGHVRLASCGRHTHSNTHPFSLKKWAFAHNGTVEGIMGHPDFKLTRYYPQGSTDSEYAFCRIMEAIEDGEGDIDVIVASEAERIHAYGKLNFLLSDGKQLYAYGDNSLFYTERKAPFPKVTLVDDECKVDLNEVKRHDERAVVIATEPLTTGEEWVRIEGLKVFGGE